MPNIMKNLRKQLILRKRLGVKYVRVKPASALRGSTIRSKGLDHAEARRNSFPPSKPPTEPASPSTLPVRSGQTGSTPMGRSPRTEPVWCLGEGARADELRRLRDRIKDCQDCPLGKTRIHFVFGMGNPDAKVLFIGEAPGADEDEQGLPFVGRAGQLLTKIIESTKTWKREDVFIANVLKCRPPGNRPPLPEEVEHCLPYLKQQIAILKPVLIMALGASAAQSLLNTKVAVGKLRNQWFEMEGIPLRVTYHPAALFRFEGYKKDVWQDMKDLTAKYQEINPK
jgi:uracil-DNA glycosylase family 4